jgi:hypothetical protein
MGHTVNQEGSDSVCQAVRPAAVRSGSHGFTRFLAATAAFAVVGLAAIWTGNRAFAPEMYSSSGVAEIAAALGEGRHQAVFDLNLNIREIRNAHIGRLDHTPDVVVLGASHWQEANAGLVPHKRLYNAHVHRDYFEDMLAVTEMLVHHNRLPKQMIVAIRDNQFTPIAARRDYLWLPGITYYRQMAHRLNIEVQPLLDTLPVRQWQELVSLPMLHANVVRWHEASARPHATLANSHPTLDLLLPDGSIVWAHARRASFTQARAERLSAEFAGQRAFDPPRIDPAGIGAVDALFSFLRRRNVELFLAHPPFNPAFYERVQGSPYMAGLETIEWITGELAKKHGAHVIGSFDPATLGCTRAMYIDAEHANSECLRRIFDQYVAIDTAGAAAPTRPRTQAASQQLESGR